MTCLWLLAPPAPVNRYLPLVEIALRQLRVLIEHESAEALKLVRAAGLEVPHASHH